MDETNDRIGSNFNTTAWLLPHTISDKRPGA
jgi:hypothetical protein